MNEEELQLIMSVTDAMDYLSDIGVAMGPSEMASEAAALRVSLSRALDRFEAARDRALAVVDEDGL